MYRDNGLLGGWVDGLEGLALNTFHPLAVDVQAERLLVGDARRLDLLGERHGHKMLFLLILRLLRQRGITGKEGRREETEQIEEEEE